MSRARRTRRGSGALALALGGLFASVLVTAAAPAHAAEERRLAGGSRYDTAVAISRHGFPDGASTVYLARGDAFADALAAGTLPGGPILLVPPNGSVPAAVAAEVRRLAPSTVVALGGPAAVPQRTLDALAAGRRAERLQGASRYETAVAVSRAGFPGGAERVFLARGDGYADALAAGALTGGPILLVPSTGAVPASVAAEVSRLDPDLVIALGGGSAVPEATLTALAAGRTPLRLAGGTRYQTATAITAYGFPGRAGEVYLARGDGFADALAAGALDAPVLLVPSSGAVPPEVRAEVQRLGPGTVVALGGEPAVPASTLRALATVAPAPMPAPPGTPQPPPGPPAPGGETPPAPTRASSLFAAAVGKQAETASAMAAVASHWVYLDLLGNGTVNSVANDRNNDGWYDIAYTDTNGDRAYDFVQFDEDYSGAYEWVWARTAGVGQVWLHDHNGDGYHEHGYLDLDGNGRYEVQKWDGNGDRIYEWVAVDYSGDGIADTWVSGTPTTPSANTASRTANDAMVKHIVLMNQLRQCLRPGRC